MWKGLTLVYCRGGIGQQLVATGQEEGKACQADEGRNGLNPGGRRGREED